MLYWSDFWDWYVSVCLCGCGFNGGVLLMFNVRG